MSIVATSYPNPIDDYADFSIDTDLVEDATHINLRIRAEIYHEGIIRAVVEKPKGMVNFDFANILKSLTPGLKFARDSGLTHQSGSAGANRVDMAWDGSSYTTFTTIANSVTSAIGTTPATVQLGLSTGSGLLIPMTAGKTYILYILNYVNSLGPSGRASIQIYDIGGVTCNLIRQSNFLGYTETNKQILIQCTTSGDCFIMLSNAAASNWSGDFYFKEITTDTETIGSPLCPYYPVFTEIWETALGVTTYGGNSITAGWGILRYVPARILGLIGGTPYSNFYQYYVIKSTGSFFANTTLRNNVTKFYTAVPLEYWVIFFTEAVSMELNYSKDGGANDHSVHPFCYEGWCAIILNIGELMASVTSTLAFYMKQLDTTEIVSETITIRVSSQPIDERTVLEYDGGSGGKEYLSFEGLKDIKYNTIRDYYTGSKKGRKPLALTGLNRQTLETRFTDINNASYLKGLMISESVKKLNPAYATPTDVTIITDTVKISNSEMFTNQIEIEYEDD